MQKLKTIKSMIFGLTALIGIQGVAYAEPIKIALSEWTGQHISAHFAANLFKRNFTGDLCYGPQVKHSFF